jgi:hypothetical protein
MTDKLTLDFEQLRVDDPSLLNPPSKKAPRHKPGEKFLKGPIPLNWLSVAAAQPGKTFQAAIALWFWAGMKRSRQIPFSMSWLKTTFGVDRRPGYRGLAMLEKAGLVIVVRHRGRNPVIELLDASEMSLCRPIKRKGFAGGTP